MKGDNDILRDLLSLSLDLLGAEETRAKGETLYEILKHMEDRLTPKWAAPDPVLEDLVPAAEGQGLAGQIFHFHSGCTVYLTVNR